jgi:hypothetical protein
MSTVRSGVTFGEKAADARELRGLGPEDRRERHALDVAARRRARRVHVAVRVDPDETERLVLAPQEIRRGRDRAGRERMVAAQHDRDAPLLEHRERGLVETLAHARDLADVFLTRVPERLDLGDRRHEIAGVHDRDPERRQAFPRPAIRKADGPMSTPRRLPPRSRDTPMMCAGRGISRTASRTVEI